MSTFTTSAATIGTALVAVYGIGLFTGPSISTEIEIAARPSIVWEKLTDGDAYPEWNPFVKHLSGDFKVGNRINVTIQPEGYSPMDFTPEVLTADKNTELRWVGRLGFKGIFDGEHYFILEETAQGTTLLRHGENFSGILGYPLLALIRKNTMKGFEAMNVALKERADSFG
ncbi:MAG: SRPBCC domain-containing protein [Lentilitoribacter sp.]